MKSFLASLALGLLVSVGCSQSHGPAADAGADAEITKVSTVLCGGCGEVKGSESCCAADAEVCDCGLHKGSPGCCNIEKGTDVLLCSDCGEVAGGEKCCAKGAEVCGCGAHKGAPGCCIKKKSEDSAAREDGSGTKDDEANEAVEDAADAA